MIESRIIRSAKYAEWFANIVVVPKKNKKMRICIDFTDLNKSCPKDSYPLPDIPQTVESVIGCERISLMDNYSGYNQIPLAEVYQENTRFLAPRGLYYYTRMLFELRNTRATNRRMMEKVFKP